MNCLQKSVDKKKILVVGANCAWQKVLIFDAFAENKINRAKEIYQFASGKGINFARAAKIYGKFEPHALQFIGGMAGEAILKDLSLENIETANVTVEGETRTCTTCLNRDGGTTTEIIEPSPSASAENIANFFEFSKLLLSEPEFSAVAICGTLINEVSTDLYFDIAENAIRNGKVLLLDTYRNMEKVFELKSNSVILKINRDELQELTHLNDVSEAMLNLINRYNFGAVLITDGAEKSYLAVNDGKFYEFELPPLDKVLNPIGSGDTASGVFLSEYLSSGNLIESAKIALAAASANCRSVKCGEFELDYMSEYAGKIRVYER